MDNEHLLDKVQNLMLDMEERANTRFSRKLKLNFDKPTDELIDLINRESAKLRTDIDKFHTRLGERFDRIESKLDSNCATYWSPSCARWRVSGSSWMGNDT
jgi:hypothetical protein